MDLLDVFDGGFFGHVDGLADSAGQERLDGGHHLDVAEVVDGVVTHRASKDGFVLFFEVRRAEDGFFFVDVG